MRTMYSKKKKKNAQKDGLHPEDKVVKCNEYQNEQNNLRDDMQQ